MGCRACSKECQKETTELKKPVIYLYPETTIDVEIKLHSKNSKLACIYPKFNGEDNTWKVKASPNGEITILDKNILIYSGKQNHTLIKM